MLDFPAIAAHLLPQSLALLQEWFPAGRLHGREYKVGNLAGDAGESLSINIDSGKWGDFSTSHKGGDLLSLYAAIHGLTQSQAAKRLSNGHADKIEDIYTIGQQCHPIPRHKHGKPSGIWEYKASDGETLGYICRFEVLNEGKQFAPLTCWQAANGAYRWKWKKWPNASPLYQADKLAADPAAKVLIVEGEKTADAAQKLLPDWVITTWPGGAGAVKQADWSALQSRYCWCWPDNDKAGTNAASSLKKILPHLQIVTLPDGLPEAWDLGDAASDFPILDYFKTIAPSASVKQTDIVAETKIQRAELIFTHHDPEKTSRLLGTLSNLRDLLRHYQITVRYNVISKRIFFAIPGEEFSSENYEDAAFACIYSYMKEWKLPTDGYQPYLMRVADENQYNPVLEWIRSKPWDGFSRLQSFYDTIASPETEAKELLIRRWLITAVCMALGEGVDSAGCLVLQGPQDLGKTWWVKMLVPEVLRNEFIRTDANVDPSEKDSVSQIISYWIVELGEIGATFRKADIDALKAFITRDHDTMRRPYGLGDKRYPRRTALIASVDQMLYLHDTAGNRRFWTIPCTAINSYHQINMQQLWAEVLHLVENKGETWQLAPDEKDHIRRINEEHMQIDPIYEKIRDFYEWEWTCNHPQSATQIAEAVGMKNITQRETRIITSVVLKLNNNQRETGNKRRLLVPMRV